MSPELRELIATTRWHKAAVQAAAALLPPDDAELDGWVAEAVASNDEVAFPFIVTAALAMERKVDARHLARGATLAPNQFSLGSMAWRMQGDVCAHLLTAVRETILGTECHAMALLVAAAWWREQQKGAFPPALIAEARLFTHRRKPTGDALNLLHAMATIVTDPALTDVLSEVDPLRAAPEYDAKKQALAEAAMKVWCQPVLDLVVERPSDQLGNGGAVRRSVPRIGRNDLCPCGSGLKYKRCCTDKDQERLRLSSDIAGKTVAEVRAEPELHLTLSRLEKARPHEVARYDPEKVPPALRGEYLTRLGVYGPFERAAEVFEKFGCPDELVDAWDIAVLYATRAGCKEAAERLVQVRTTAGENLENFVEASTRVLLVRDDPAATVDILQAIGNGAFASDDPEHLTRIAISLLYSPLCALGILVARSMIPLLDKQAAGFILQEILEARDRLSLPPDEPYADLLEKRYADELIEDDRDAAKSRVVLARLEQKSAEVRRLNESLAEARREIERREIPPALVPSPANPSIEVTDEALRELRTKVAALKSDLKQRHSERSELRRELEKAHADLEALRTAARQSPTTTESTDTEQDLTLPGEIEGHQPLRLIEFPRKFPDTLAAVPRHVARNALALLGRIAGGEPAAFAGVVRLKALPNTMRARVGIDHRLLFRLGSNSVEVVDLIPRQDLERRIKTLL